MGRRNSQGLNFRKKRLKVEGDSLREAVSYLFRIAAAIGLALFLVRTWGLRTSVIGSSMETALYNGQTIFVSRLTYLLSKPRYGDIIVFLPNGNEYTHYYVKRVVGVPGDTIQIIDGYIYINGNMEDNDDYDKIEDPGVAENPIELKTDEYFVLGDNRNNGEDSRSGNIGPVNISLIEGRAWFKLSMDDSKFGFIKRGKKR
ncbi:MAG: signal peptidase I [Lachnospiraceae bacterium]|nr:signal peptidase I [Lachnospiraceae bacterium]